MGDSAVIVGVGMTTAVGLSAAETAASVRAGTARFSTTHFRDRAFEQLTLAEVPADGLPPLPEGLAKTTRLSAREARMLRLAAAPIRECLQGLRARNLPRLALCLALPEIETTRPLDRRGFLRDLSRSVDNMFDPEASDASHAGRAGGVVAVGQAVATIVDGRCDFVLAGGIESFIDLYVLGTLDMERRVKSARNLDGFVPGEAAGFVLLARPEAAQARGLVPLAAVSSVATGFETGHLYSTEPYRGEGLAAAVAQLRSLTTGPMEDVYSSMNGESHWTKEWGVSYMRNRGFIAEGFRMHHPADSFGDTGAACGPVMIGLASLAMRGDYRRSPALVYGSSDWGARAALIVNALPH